MDQKIDFTKVFKDYGDDVYRYVYFRLRNREETEDIVSETFTKLIKKEHLAEDHLKPWLITVARNIMIDKYRRTTEKKIDLDDSIINDFDIEEVDISQEIVEESMVETIKTHLEELDDVTKEIVTLKIWEEMTFAEIAKLTKSTESKVKSRFYRGIETIKHNISRKDKKPVTVGVILAGVFAISTKPVYAMTGEFNLLLLDKMTEATLAANAAGTVGATTFWGAKTIILACGALVIGTCAGAAIGYNVNPNNQANNPVVTSSSSSTASSSETSSTTTTSSETTTTTSKSSSSAAAVKPKTFTLVYKQADLLINSETKFQMDVYGDVQYSVNNPKFTAKGEDFTLTLTRFYESESQGFEDYTKVANAETKFMGRHKSGNTWTYTNDATPNDAECNYTGITFNAPCGVADLVLPNNQANPKTLIVAECSGNVSRCDDLMRSFKIVSIKNL